MSMHVNLIYQFKSKKKQMKNNYLKSSSDSKKEVKKLVVQNLQNIYQSQAQQNYSETIKGALDREIKRQEENKNQNLIESDAERRINFNPSAYQDSYNDTPRENNRSMLMIDESPNVNQVAQLRLEQRMSQNRPQSSLEETPNQSTEQIQQTREYRGSSDDEDINFIQRETVDQNLDVNPKFDDEGLINNSDDENSSNQQIVQQPVEAPIEEKNEDESSERHGSNDSNEDERQQILKREDTKSDSTVLHEKIAQSLGKTFGNKVAKENKDPSKLAIKKKLREMKNDLDNHDPEEVNKFFKDQLIRKMKDESQLSLRALRDHIRQQHCKKNNEEWWPITTELGSFFSFHKEFELTQALRDIGLGPSLYLLTLKALGKMFLILTILNIPCMYFFLSGTEHLSPNHNLFQKFFASISLGNLGELGPQCHQMNLAKEKSSLTLQCQSGTLDRIDSFGLSSKFDQHCDNRDLRHNYGMVHQDLSITLQSHIFSQEERENHPNSKFYSSFIPYNTKCASYGPSLNTTFANNLQKNFKQFCKDSIQCMIDFDYKELNKDCIEEIDQRIKDSRFRSNPFGALHTKHTIPVNQQDDGIEPIFFVVISCKNVDIQLKGTETFLSKRTVSILLVVCDIISMVFVLCFINILQHLQHDFSNLFDVNTIEVRDFSIKIDQLPAPYKQCEDEIDVKFKLWKQINQMVQDAKDAGLCCKDLNPQIVDIQFGLRNYSSLKDLKRLESKCHEVENISYMMRNAKKNKQKMQYMKNFEKKQQKLKTYMEKHRKVHGETSFAAKLKHNQQHNHVKQSVYNDIQVVYVTFLNMDTKNLIFEKLMPANGRLDPMMQKFYNERQKIKGKNDKNNNLNQLMSNMQKQSTHNFGQPEKIKMTVPALGDLNNKTNPQQQNIRTLQNMINNRGNNSIFSDEVSSSSSQNNKEGGLSEQQNQPALKKQRTSKEIKNLLAQQLSKSYQSEKERIANTIKSTQPVDPEFILWDNIGYTNLSRKMRKTFSIFIAFTIIGFSFFIVMESNWYRNHLMVQEPSVKCNIQPTKFQAYEDILLPKNQRHHYMPCYCYDQLMNNYNTFFNIDFTEFGNTKAKNFCIEWLKSYSFTNIVYRFSFLVVVLINLVAQEIFILVARNEKQMYSAHENQSIFEYIFYQSFINIGIILIFTDLNAKFLEYGEFDTFWYIEIGSQLCFTMIVQNYSSKGGDIARIIWVLLTRFYDRGFSQDEKKIGEDDDTPNTKKLRQQELEELYTGPQIKIGYKMSYTFTYIFVGLSYSSGLPILYPTCFLYFLMTYWFDKACILRFYQRSKDFNEELPIKSVSLMKYAVMLHFIFSFFIYSSSPLNARYVEQPNFSQDLNTINPAQSKFLSSYIIVFLVFIIIAMTGFLLNQTLGNCFQNFLHQTWHQIIEKKSEFEVQEEDEHDLSHSEKSKIQNRLHGGDKSQGGGLHSNNFYGEILFDYLLTHYENNIYYYNLLMEKKDRIQSKDIEEYKQYIKQCKTNIALMEQQIDFYYEFLIQKMKDGDSFWVGLDTKQITELLEINPINKKMQSLNINENKESSLMFSLNQNQQTLNRQSQDPSICLSPVSSISLNTRQKFFLEKLEFLDSWFDEDGIHQAHLKDNLRCATFIQSYNILDNPLYQEADEAFDRAKLLTQDNFFIQDIEYDSSSDESSSQASDESISVISSIPDCSSGSAHTDSIIESQSEPSQISKDKSDDD